MLSDISNDVIFWPGATSVLWVKLSFSENSEKLSAYICGEKRSVYHHPDNFGGYRYYGMGDLITLVCHVTSSNHVFKGLRIFMGGSSTV